MKTIIITIIITFVCFFSINASAHPIEKKEENKLPEILVNKINDNMYNLYVNDYVYVLAFIGPEGVLLVDSGFGNTEQQIKSKLKELGNDNIKYLINTHADRDHCEGNPVLGKNAVIIAHTVTRNLLDQYKVFKGKEYALPAITFENELTLYFNSEKIRLIPMAESHTPMDIILHFSKANIVHLADLVLPDSFPLVKVDYGANVEKLVENLEKIIHMFPADVTFVVSHGRNCTMEDLKKYHDMLIKTIKIISTAKKAGKSAEDMKKERILKDWEDWNNKKYKWINADLWIDTVYKSLKKL